MNTVVDNIHKKIKARKEANREILRVLTHYIEAHDEIRFGQALVNLGIVQLIQDPASFDILGAKDPFNEESVDTLKRMK